MEKEIKIWIKIPALITSLGIFLNVKFNYKIEIVKPHLDRIGVGIKQG